MDNVKVLEKIVKQKDEFYSEINKVIIGQHDVIEYILLCTISFFFLCKISIWSKAIFEFPAKINAFLFFTRFFA